MRVCRLEVSIVMGRFSIIAASAIQLLVEFLCGPYLDRQRGHDKTRVLFSLQVFGLGNDTTLPTPAATHCFVEE